MIRTNKILCPECLKKNKRVYMKLTKIEEILRCKECNHTLRPGQLADYFKKNKDVFEIY